MTPTARAELSRRSTEAVRRAAKAMHALGVAARRLRRHAHGQRRELGRRCSTRAALIGAVTVPVNTRFKAAELAFCLRAGRRARRCSSPTASSRSTSLSFLREAEPAVDRALPGEALPLLRHVVVIGEDVPAGGPRLRRFPRARATASATRRSTRSPAQVTPDDLLLIQFTSGTTAYPKGVMLTHDNMLRNAWAVGPAPGDPAPTTATSTAGRSSTSPAPRFRCWSRSSPAPAWSRCRPSRPAPRSHMMARERCTLTSGNDTLFQLMMGHPSFDPREAAPARRLGGGGPGDHAQHHRRRWARATSAWPTACRKPRPTSCSTTIATPSSCASPGSRSRTTASRCASPTRDRRGAAGGRDAARSRCAAGT